VKAEKLCATVKKDMISMSGLNYALTLVTALGCGIIAGVFFGFSTFIMKALARLPLRGIAAMQSTTSWQSILSGGFSRHRRPLRRIDGCRRRAIAQAIRPLPAPGRTGLPPRLLPGQLFSTSHEQCLAALPVAASDRAARWTAYLANWTT
jgi:hypothetical protein